MTDLTHIDDLVVDPETGEIIQWPADVGPSRIDYLQAAYVEAREEESAWKLTKQGLGRALDQHLGDAGVASYNGAAWRSTHVVVKDAFKIYRPTVELLVAAKVINGEQADELAERTAAMLDEFKLEAADAMVEAGSLTAEQRDLLIVREPRASYVRTGKLPKAEPKRARTLRAEYDAAVGA